VNAYKGERDIDAYLSPSFSISLSYSLSSLHRLSSSSARMVKNIIVIGGKFGSVSSVMMLAATQIEMSMRF
jgi:hypothetical protein